MIEVISFDIWGTLFRTDPGYRSEQRKALRDVLGYRGDTAQLRRHLYRVYAELDAETEAHGIQFGLEDRVMRLAADLGLPVPTPEQLDELQRLLTVAQLSHPPVLTEPDLKEVLETLAQMGLRIAVISNTNMTVGNVVHESLVHHNLADLINWEVYSGDIGVAKPNPKIFSRLVEMSGYPAHSILHVGDNKVTDLHGARRSGFDSILYERRQRLPQSHDVIWAHSELLGRFDGRG